MRNRKRGREKGRRRANPRIQNASRSTPDVTQASNCDGEDPDLLVAHAEQIRALAATYGIGLADSLQACMDYCSSGDLSDLLSWSNHPFPRHSEGAAEGPPSMRRSR